MDRHDSTQLFRLRGVQRLSSGIACTVSLQEAPLGDSPCQRIVYYEDRSLIDYEIPEAAFTPVLRKNEILLKKILSNCIKAAGTDDIDIPFVFPERCEERIIPDDAIQIFTDGSLAQTGIGGWAGIINYATGAARETSGREPCDGSNRTELLAVVNTLNLLDRDGPAVVNTDSRYVIRGAEVWLFNWERNGFFTAQNRPVKNRDLWEALSALRRRREIHFRWIPSSDDHPHHRRCDLLAREMSLSSP